MDLGLPTSKESPFVNREPLKDVVVMVKLAGPPLDTRHGDHDTSSGELS